MAKHQTPKAAGATAAADDRVIHTVHGETIPASELTHIAPHLQPFAMAVGKLKQDPTNARQHGKKDLDSTGKSLAEFGQQELIQFDPETLIVKVGNGRHAAASRILEWRWIAAAASNLTGAKLRAFALAHNRTAELSEWNMDALQKELDALNAMSEDVESGLEALSLDNMGFSSEDLAELEEDSARRDKAKATSVEDKKSQSIEGTTYQVVISCNNERMQTQLLAQLENTTDKKLGKLLTGRDVKARQV